MISPAVAVRTDPLPISILALEKLVTSDMPRFSSLLPTLLSTADLMKLSVIDEPKPLELAVAEPVALTFRPECAVSVSVPLAVRCAPESVIPVLALASRPSLMIGSLTAVWSDIRVRSPVTSAVPLEEIFELLCTERLYPVTPVEPSSVTRSWVARWSPPS